MKTLSGGVILTIILLAYPVISYAQKRHTLEFGSGLFTEITLNKLISPLRYHGQSMPMYLDYNVIAPKFNFIISGYYSYQKLYSGTSFLPRHYQKEIRGELYFGYLRNISGFPDKRFKLYAGLFHDIAFSYQRQFYDPANEEQFVDVSVSMIGASMGYHMSLTQHDVIRQDVNLTLIGLNLRTPYYGLRHYLTTYLELPDNNLRIFHQLSYFHIINNHFQLGFRYRFLYHEYDHPFKAHVINDNYLIILGFTL